MADFFNSALSYFGAGGSGEGRGSGGGDRFVGQTVDLGEGNRLKVKKVIAEGGYGYVFVAQDIKTGKHYALKRQVVAKENINTIKKEIAFMKQLSGHPHIVQYVASAGAPPTQTLHGSAEFLIQIELCSGGRLEDVVKAARLTPRQVLRVFHAACSAVAHMHAQHPAIIHRDIKVENLLLSADGTVKLCDFGSATTQQVNPDHSWTAIQRGLAEDEINSNTTPMYRSPEMCDLYSNQPVSEKADVWALGCLLFKLCFQEHPFEDSAKLKIINAKYKIPAGDSTYAPFHNIIKMCLVAEPGRRPSVDALLAQLYSVADQLGDSLEQPSAESLLTTAPGARKQQRAPSPQPPRKQQRAPSPQPPRPPQPQGGEPVPLGGEGGGVGEEEGSSSERGGGAQRLFGFMKDGAGSLFKNIKESSSKAWQTMAAGMPKRSSLDVSYITSRILAMSYPHGDGFHSNSVEEVRSFLDDHHPNQYLVFNLSGHSYDTSKLNNQVYVFDWPHRGLPALEKLVDLCRSMDAWLRADQCNVIVIHCSDGRLVTGVVVAAYLLFVGAVQSPDRALRLFSAKRLSPDHAPLRPSPCHSCYLGYMAQLVSPQVAYKPHPHRLVLNMLRLSSVPLYNAIRTGCKPFVEVFQDGERVFTSASSDTLDHIRSFSSQDGGVEVPLGFTGQGNLLIIVHHIRAIPLTRKAGVGMTAVRMFQFQVHTGFLSTECRVFKLERHDLEGSAIHKEEKFPRPFEVTLEMEWEHVDEPQSLSSWQNLPYPCAMPLTCFSSKTEQDEFTRTPVSADGRAAAVQSRPLPDTPPSQASHPHTSPTAHHPPHHHTSPTAHHSPHHHQPHTFPKDEESSSAGGSGLSTATAAPPTGTNGSSTHNFFSQLNWQEQTTADAGYVPFLDQVDSNSDSDSEDDEEEEFQPPSSRGGSEIHPSAGGSANFANFDGHFQHRTVVGNPHAEMLEPPEIKLIEFGFPEGDSDEDDDDQEEEEGTPSSTSDSRHQQPQQQQYRDPFQTTTNPPAQFSSNGIFGDNFGDPWQTSQQQFRGKSALEISDLLGLEDSDEHSTLSLVSEARAAGAETFRPRAVPPKEKKDQAKKTSAGPGAFDPFGFPTTSGSTAGGHHQTSTTTPILVGGEPFGGGAKPLDPSSPVSSPLRREQEDLFDPNFLVATHHQSQQQQGSGNSKLRNTSQPVFGNTLTTAGGFGLGNVSSHSQPNLVTWGTNGGGGGGGGGGGSRKKTPSPKSVTPDVGRSPTHSPVPFAGAHFSSSTGNINQMSQQSKRSGDPFAQFNIQQISGAKPNLPQSTAPSQAPPGHPAFQPMTNRPAYQPYYMQQQQQAQSGSSQASSSNSKPPLSHSQSSRPPQGTAAGSAFSQAPRPKSPMRPNYNLSMNDTRPTKTGVRPNVSSEAFSDILNTQGFRSSKEGDGHRSLKDMRGQADGPQDPDRAKVAAWAERKERNIRALVSSLHEILWEGEARWREVGMHQLVQPDQVKKFYRKACLSVHPDKVQGTANENLARAIFDELNDAYDRFEESGAKPLY